MAKEWFETWFDTRYYHLLYRNRNEVEARQFIDALLHYLNPPSRARFLDVACGKGRHSRYLHNLGYAVTGIDLSANSIDKARALCEPDAYLRFEQHDIRNPFPVVGFDVALNLFTSFGYFETDAEHQEAINNMHGCLRPQGCLVMDYFNTEEVLDNLKCEDHAVVEGVAFSIRRYEEDGYIVKHISVNEGRVTKTFQERVRAFTKPELERGLRRAGFDIQNVFGNYTLDAFTTHSPRVVIIAEKKA